MEKMRKVFDFGKFDWYGTGRRINRITVEVELRPCKKNNGQEVIEFAASGQVWNSRHTDIVCGGQCLDEIAKIPSLRCSETFRTIYKYWKLYHLNTMKAGSPKQCHIVNLLRMVGIRDYKKQCDFLAKHNLLEHEGRKYGHAWYYDPIPAPDLERIKILLSF